MNLDQRDLTTLIAELAHAVFKAELASDDPEERGYLSSARLGLEMPERALRRHRDYLATQRREEPGEAQSATHGQREHQDQGAVLSGPSNDPTYYCPECGNRANGPETRCHGVRPEREC